MGIGEIVVEVETKRSLFVERAFEMVVPIDATPFEARIDDADGPRVEALRRRCHR